jgi:hypothetical protein
LPQLSFTNTFVVGPTLALLELSLPRSSLVALPFYSLAEKGRQRCKSNFLPLLNLELLIVLSVLLSLLLLEPGLKWHRRFLHLTVLSDCYVDLLGWPCSGGGVSLSGRLTD